MNNFYWDTEQDGNAFKTFSSLVKYNGGMFKSLKQANYLTSSKPFTYLWNDPKENDEERIKANTKNAKDYFNVELDAKTQCMAILKATVRWADYGQKSQRRAEWVFVWDKYGVVAQYKLHFIYTSGGAVVNPKKTELLFKRDPNASLPVFEEPVAPEVPSSNYIGTVGKREEFVLTVKMVREFQGQSFSYYDSGLRIMTVMETVAGDKVVYWNRVGEVGEKLLVKATVKAQDEYKGVKQTTLSRAKVLKVFETVEETV